MVYFTLFKKNRTSIYFTLLLILNSIAGFSQCPVTATSNVITIKCGDQAILSAIPYGCRPLDNNFNSGDLGTSWQATPGAIVTNGTGTYACAGAPPEGTNYLWVGDNIQAPRGVTTNSYDLKQCGSTGGTLSFYMKYSTQQGVSPCEGPDINGEGVHVQYSANGTAGPWIDLMYNEPIGGYDPVLTNWKQYNLVLPAAALTTTTSFRWYQANSSAVDNDGDGIKEDFRYDTWGLDAVVIILTVPGYTYDWAHDAQGPAATPATPPVSPTATTTYTVTYTNGLDTCTSAITVNVLTPTITASASPIAICSGQNSQLDSVVGNTNFKPTTCGINSVGCVGTPSLLTVGTGTTTGATPFDGGMSASTRMQMLYLKSELPAGTSAGQINSIAFYVESLSTGSKTYQNCIVKIGCTSMAAFGNGSVSPVPNLLTVRNPKTVTLVAGWNTLVFDQTYNWDGMSNILVEICWANSGTSSPAPTFRNTTTSFSSVYYNGTLFSNNLCGDTTAKASIKARPNIQFGYCDSVIDTSAWIYSWTPTTGLDNPAIKNPIATPTSTTTYTVSFYSPSNAACASTDSQQITITVTPPPIAVDATKCGTSTVDLSVTGCSGTVNWYTAASGGASIFTGANFTTPLITATTTYYATCTTSGCESSRVPVIATIANGITPTFAAIPPICSGDIAPVLPTSSTNSPPIVGSWSGPVSNTTSASYTFTPNSGQCANSMMLPVTVNPRIASTITCGTSTTNSVQFNWSAVTGATNYDVSYQIGANPIVVVGPVGNVLTYSVTGLLPNDTVTITITPTTASGGCFLPTTQTCTANTCVVSGATISYANPFCSNNGTSQMVTLTGSGNYTGGTYVATGGLIINPITGDINPNTAGNYSVTYTLLGTGGCPPVIATTNVVVTELPRAIINYSGSPFCNNNAVPQLVTITGTAAFTGGIYSSSPGGLSLNSTSGVITANTSLPGTYTVTYTIPAAAGCPSVPVTTTVIVTPAPTVSISYATPFCNSITASQSVIITGTGLYTGGAYSSISGLSINPVTGAITPSTSSAGTYIVTYTAPASGGCQSIIGNTTVVITELPTAIINYAGSPFCNNNTSPQSVTITGTAAYTGGVYSSSPGGLSLNPNTGDITANTSLPGTFTVTYTIPAGAGCPSVPVNTTVIVTPAPTVNISYAVPFCNSTTISQSVTITGTGAYTGGTYSSTIGLTLNAITGAITPSTSLAGTYIVTYTAHGSGGCQSIIGNTTVVITALPTAIILYAGSPFCNNNAVLQSVTITGTAAYTGGVYSSSPLGLTLNPTSGVITSNTSLPGNYTITYTIPAGVGCPSLPVNTTVTVTPAPTATITYASPFCISNRISQNVTITGTGAYTGGTYSSTTGLAIDAITGAIMPNNSLAGTYIVTYTIPATGGCLMTTTTTNVVINELPIAIATPDLHTLCSGETTGITLTSTILGTTFSWTVIQSNVNGATSGTGNTIAQTLTNTGIASGTVIYFITPMANGCTGNVITVTITVNPAPIATATPSIQTICSGQTTGIILTSNLAGTTYNWTYTQSGVTGASNGSGNVISQLLNATTTDLGTVIYTITPILNSCVGLPITVIITVTPPPTAIVTPTVQTICSEDTTNIVLSGNIPGTVFNWNVIQSNLTGAFAGSGNAIQQTLQTITTNAGQAVYEVTPIMNGCPGEPVMIVITVNPKPIVTANPTEQTICSGSTTGINLSSNLAATTFNWVVIQNGVFGATSGMGDIIAQRLTTVGVMQGSVDYIITPISNGCPGNSITVTVTVKPTPEVFGAPTSTICSGESPNITLFPSIPGTTFTWTALAIGVIGATNGSGDVIDQNLETNGAITGTVIYTITPTANDCVGEPIDIEIKVNPLPLPDLEDGIICIDQTTGDATSTYTLDTGLSNSGYTFIWYYNNSTTPISGAASSTYEATESGVYSVQATNTITGCISELEFANITESYPGTDFSVVTSVPFSNNPSITVNVTPVNPNYRYSLNGGSPQESNVFAPVALGSHTVHISDSNGCTDKTITVFVIGYPHYYTPNGDGINDNWNVVGVNDPNAKLYIFDRYGKLIKQISPIGEGWDGTYNGEELPSTDYWFTIDYNESLTGNNSVFKSHFSLKR